MNYFFYIVRCQDNGLYIGCTSLLPAKRIERHNAGTGAKWFLQHGPGMVVYTEKYPTLVEVAAEKPRSKNGRESRKSALFEV